MNTPAHLIFGASAFARPDRKGSLAAAFAGSLAPDVSLYLLVAVAIWGMGIPPQTVFDEYYYSDAWQTVFAVDNSFILWGMLLCLALWRRGPLLIVFAGAGLLHLAFDFPLHTHDARQHFWPVTDWVFVSPFSYWDGAAHAGTIGLGTLSMTLALAALLIARFQALAPVAAHGDPPGSLGAKSSENPNAWICSSLAPTFSANSATQGNSSRLCGVSVNRNPNLIPRTWSSGSLVLIVSKAFGELRIRLCDAGVPSIDIMRRSVTSSIASSRSGFSAMPLVTTAVCSPTCLAWDRT